MAAIHARAFAGQGRNWSATEIGRLLKSAHVFAVGGLHAFALGRVVADEAELLTLATEPAHRGQGLGRAALRAFEVEAVARGACTAFLEVAADNRAALALYLAERYDEAARRPAYYQRETAIRIDALILRKSL